MPVHRNLKLSELHAIQSWQFASAAARNAAVVTADDVGRVALELDTDTVWILAEAGPPPLWVELSNSTNDPVPGFGPGIYKPLRSIFDRTAVIPATPNAVLIDEDIDLAQYGLTATTYRHANFNIRIEKPDGQGGWVQTNAPRMQFFDYGVGDQVSPPGVPAADPEGYEVSGLVWPSPMKLPKLPGGDPPFKEETFGMTSGQDPGRDWWNGRGAKPGLNYAPQAEDRITRVRIVVVRSSKVYTPEEQALINSYGYRVRVTIDAQDLVVWEREVSISPDNNTMLLNEQLRLSDYGLISDHDRFRFVAVVKRNGKVIKTYMANEYVLGEQFDPPSFPVVWAVRPVMPDTPWWNAQNSSESGRKIGGGWSHNGALAQCSESVRDHIRVMAWRHGNLATEYYDGTIGQANINLADVDPAMGGVLVAMTGAQTAPYGDGFIPSEQLKVVFTPMVAPYTNAFTGQDQNAWAIARRYGMEVFFVPGLTTLQDVWDAIDMANAYLSPAEDAAATYTGQIRTGALTTPAYVFAQTQAFETSLVTVESAAPVPVPGNAGDNCTLLIRLLVAPPNRMWEWPFWDGATNDQGISQVLLRNTQTPVNYPPGGSGGFDIGIWNSQGQLMVGDKRVALATDMPDSSLPIFTTATRPAADATWWRRTISVKDPGVDEVIQYCRQKADDTYEWVALPLG